MSASPTPTGPASPSPSDNAARRPNVAVVAVHGIGDHDAGASARSIAQLLLRLRQPHLSEDNRYTSFKSVGLNIPLKRAHIAPDTHVRSRNWVGELRAAFQERSDAVDVLREKMRAERADDGVKAETLRSTDGIDHQFMRAQLVGYPGSDVPYETVRYEGQRLTEGDRERPDADVHVYEMYWSDLSRLGENVTHIASELFQLIFHIPHLGRLAVDHAAIEFANRPLWSAFRMVHTVAVRLFTLVVPLFWLTMAATILSVTPSAAPERWAVAIAITAAVLASASGAAVVLYRLKRRPLPPYIGIPLAAALGAAVVLYALQQLGHERVLTLEWVALATGVSILAARRYQRIRLGAAALGTILAVVSGLALAGFVAVSPSRAQIVDWVLNVFEIQIYAMLLVWMAFYALMAVSAALGFVGTWTTPVADNARDRARRAAWTARATLTMAAVASLVIGLPIWALLFKAFEFTLPAGTHAAFTGVFGGDASPSDYIVQIFHVAAGPALIVALLATALVSLVLAFTVIPSVWTEVQPPALDPRAGETTRRVESEDANRQGRWLTVGLRIVQRGVDFLGWVLVAGAAFNVWHWVTYTGEHADFNGIAQMLGTTADTAEKLVVFSGAWLAASAIGLAAFRGRLKGILLGFGPVLDAVIDVDNYLREHPRNGTPRARIAERFASLLRYLCKWRDATGQRGYDAIVFVAHSQGTVITADYLGFLAREGDPELPHFQSIVQERQDHASARDGPALFLFTMGSPLYQLYSTSFPHLFAWVRGESGKWRQPMSPDELRGAPNPAMIGLRGWVNAYRSGDYVGRALWRPEREPYTYMPYDSAAGPLRASQDRRGTRRELCIGAGAHTHYWDSTALPVALELNRLIDVATSISVDRDVGHVELAL